jgi:hypothetical protein
MTSCGSQSSNLTICESSLLNQSDARAADKQSERQLPGSKLNLNERNCICIVNA